MTSYRVVMPSMIAVFTRIPAGPPSPGTFVGGTRPTSSHLAWRHPPCVLALCLAAPALRPRTLLGGTRPASSHFAWRHPPCVIALCLAAPALRPRALPGGTPLRLFPSHLAS